MPSATGKRVLAFIQSVRPADPAHILLLLGATCLFIAREPSWWQLHGANEFQWLAWAETNRQHELWARSVSALSLPLLVAGAAAGFLCLVPTRKPLRDLATFVLFPALVSLVAIPIVGFYSFRDALDLYASVLFHSVNDPDKGYGHAIGLLLSNLGPGFRIAAAGFVLVAIFAILLFWGRTSLPIRVRFSVTLAAGDESPEDGHRTALFIWTMICLVPLIGLLNLGLGIGLRRLLISKPGLSPELLNSADNIVEALFLFSLIVLALGKDRKVALRNVLRLPRLTYMGIAVLIPVAQGCAWPLIQYFLARNDWVEHGLGRYMVPRLGDYLTLPHPFLLWVLLGASVEEIAWRGYLQPRLVQRYGLVRGIFFVGIAWGAFHFAGDFNAYMSVGQVMVQIGMRLVEMVALSYVLGWLTIRSRSILPAAGAHGVFNIAVSGGFSATPTYMPAPVIVLAWAALGYVLFRYYRPHAMTEGAVADGTPNYEAAL